MYRRRVAIIVAAVLAAVAVVGKLALPKAGRTISGHRQVRLVVLPFENATGESRDKAFCDGFSTELALRLGRLAEQVDALWVVPAADLRGQRIDTPGDAREVLGATHVVTGELERRGSTITVRVVLTESERSRDIGAAVIKGETSNVLLLQERVLAKVASMVVPNVDPAELQVLSPERTASPRAYETYVRALGLLQRYDRRAAMEQAVTLFREALREDPSYAAAYAGLGEAYWRLYEATSDTSWIGLAWAACDTALALNGNLPRGYVARGFIRNGTGRYEEAVQDFERALDADPKGVEALRGLAHAYENLRMPEAAEAALLTAIELCPTYWGTYDDLGTLYYRWATADTVGGQHTRDELLAKATEQLERVTWMTPGNVRGMNDLAAAYYYLGRKDKAVELYTKSIAAEPTARAYNNLAVIYYNDGDYVSAAEMFEKALSFDASDYRTWGNLGSCYWHLDEMDKAADCYMRAADLAERMLAINARDVRLMLDLASYYAMLGEYARSESVLLRAAAEVPDDADALYRIAFTYMLMNRHQRALQWLERARDAGLPPERIDVRVWPDTLRSDPGFLELTQPEAART